MVELLFIVVVPRFFFFSSRRRHTRYIGDWSSDVCSSDLGEGPANRLPRLRRHRLAVLRCRRALPGHRAARPRDPGRRSEERRVGKVWITGVAESLNKKHIRKSTTPIGSRLPPSNNGDSTY